MRGPRRSPEPDKRSLANAVKDAVVGQAVDWLYLVLAGFTYFYIAALVFLFLTQFGERFLVLTRILDALAEPYLGSVGIYVILKEIRKKRPEVESKHWGGLFVTLWALLLIVSMLMVAFFETYVFDDIAGLILTMSLAVSVIYIGGVIHKP